MHLTTKTEQHNTLKIKKISHNRLPSLIGACLVFLAAVMPETAFAAAPWQTAADAILAVFTGGLSKTLATIAVIALGIMAAAGKLEWGTAIKVIVGLVLIFGAANIVNWITTAVA